LQNGPCKEVQAYMSQLVENGALNLPFSHSLCSPPISPISDTFSHPVTPTTTAATCVMPSASDSVFRFDDARIMAELETLRMNLLRRYVVVSLLATFLSHAGHIEQSVAALSQSQSLLREIQHVRKVSAKQYELEGPVGKSVTDMLVSNLIDRMEYL